MPKVFIASVKKSSGQPDLCGLNPRAAEFAQAWLGLLDNRAKIMHCDPRLVRCAQDHAVFLDSRTGEQLKQSMHIGKNGSTANQRVRAANYKLPEWHGDGNTVECCARSGQPPAAVAVSLAAHDSHRDPMMGIGFWELSLIWGVGSHGNDYVCLVCPLE